MKLTHIFKDPKERQAYKYILGLTLPIVIQNIFNAAVSSADVLMLNSVGQDAISAVSLATQYSNILMSIFLGLGSGVSMLCAQYWGKKDVKTIENQQTQEKLKKWHLPFPLVKGISTYKISIFKGRNFGEKKM